MNLSAVELLSFIHGDDEDSCIHFSAKPKGKFGKVAAIRASDTPEKFAQIEPHLSENGYFSPNGFQVPSSASKHSKMGFPEHESTKGDLQKLNGLFVDVDTGRTSKPANDPQSESTREAMWQIIETCEKNGFPLPSLWAESGQGFYLFWAFSEAVRAWPENVERIENAQKALSWIHPAWDRAAVDATRVLRIPGTKHSKNGEIARWTQNGNAATRYSEEELLRKLGVDTTTKKQAFTRAITSYPSRAKGFQSLGRNLASDIRAIHTHRRGLKEGVRRYGMTIYAIGRLMEGVSPFDMPAEIAQMASECQPPYPSHRNDQTIYEIVGSAMKIKSHLRRAETIIQRLKITSAEAEALQLQTLMPQRTEALRQIRENRVKNEGRPERAQRRQFIEKHLKFDPQASAAEVHSATQRAEIEGSLATIKRDLRDLRK